MSSAKEDWWKKIPICINNALGDPLIKSQIDNTIYKLNYLCNYKAPYSIITKAVIDDEIYEKLMSVKKSKNLVVMYSLTGLNEGGYSFDERVKTIEQLKEIFGTVIILVRPIIAKRNDNEEILRKIVNVAKNTSKILITGSVHNEFKNKQINDNVKSLLIKICQDNGVKYFHKSSCAASYITHSKCWMHDLDTPQNIEVVEKLGYNFYMKDNKICLYRATMGDLNFLRMITNSYILADKVENNYNILSIGDKDNKFEVSSSWFSWSRNTGCSINCDYCIIHEIEYLKQNCDIGIEPDRIEKYCTKQIFLEDNKDKKIKLNKIEKNINFGYNDFRTMQECRAKHYRQKETELLDLYDKDGTKTGRIVKRGESHEDFYVLSINLLIENENGEILIQKRSMNKKTRPGVWDTLTGAVLAGENSEEAVIRETKEEIGIDIDIADITKIGRVQNDTSFLDIWYIKKEFKVEDCILQKEELSDVKWISINSFLNLIKDSDYKDKVYKEFIYEYFSK